MSDQQGEHDEYMGDEVYQPDGSEVQDDAGVLEPEDTLDDRGITPAIDEGYSPPERPLAVEKSGTTASEQRERESLDERLRAEQPDAEVPAGDEIGDVIGGNGEPVDREAGDQRAGRLVGADEGSPHWPGTANDTVASDAGIAGGAATSEEAAVHIVENLENSDPAAGEDEAGTEPG